MEAHKSNPHDKFIFMFYVLNPHYKFIFIFVSTLIPIYNSSHQLFACLVSMFNYHTKHTFYLVFSRGETNCYNLR